MNAYDGYTPISGAVIDYTPNGGITRIQTITTTNITMVTISGLMPNIAYTIGVSLFNIAGASDPTYSQIWTLSRSKVYVAQSPQALVFSEGLVYAITCDPRHNLDTT